MIKLLEILISNVLAVGLFGLAGFVVFNFFFLGTVLFSNVTKDLL